MSVGNKPRIKRQRPKSGRYFVALVVGLRWEHQGPLKTALARIGVYLKYIWPANERGIASRPIPTDADAICVVREQSIGRRDREQVAHNGRKVGFAFESPIHVTGIVKAFESYGFETAQVFLDDIEPALAAEPVKTPEPEPAPYIELATRMSEPTPTTIEEPMGETKRDKRFVAAAEAVKQARMAKRMTLLQIGRMVGVSASTIGGFETLKGPISDALATAIENALELPKDTIPRLSRFKNNAKVAKAMAARPEQRSSEPTIATSEELIEAKAERFPCCDAEEAREPVAEPVARLTMGPWVGAIKEPEPALSHMEALAVDLVRLQAKLAKLGIVEITISLNGIGIRSAEIAS